MNWPTTPVQMKWTGQHLQFKWNEPVNISSSDEYEPFEQFQLSELKWNCHIPSPSSVVDEKYLS